MRYLWNDAIQNASNNVIVGENQHKGKERPLQTHFKAFFEMPFVIKVFPSRTK